MKSVLPANARCRWSWPIPPKLKKAVDRHYGQEETEDFSKILKELGSDAEIAREVSEAGEDAKAAEALANEAPIGSLSTWFCNRPSRTARVTSILNRLKPNFTSVTAWTARLRNVAAAEAPGAAGDFAPEGHVEPEHFERRLPQDGRITYNVGNREVDLRVSTLPTQFGESVVLRVLDRAAVNLDLDTLGFPKYLHDYVPRRFCGPMEF